MPHDHLSETTRIEAFSDGVFAIAITLLIIEIKVPDHSQPLGPALLRLWPSYMAFLTSFATIGIMWMNHHRVFTLIGRADQTLMVLNLLLLMGITFVPFPTAVLADRILEPGESRIAALFYSGTFFVTAIVYNVFWRYAAWNDRLIDRAVHGEAVDAITSQYRFGPLFYLLAVLVGSVQPLGQRRDQPRPGSLFPASPRADWPKTSHRIESPAGMTTYTSYPHGMFCWADLGTEPEAAKSFYTSLLGVTVSDSPIGENQFYSMLKKDGKDVAALYEQDKQQKRQQIPPYWLSYFSVKNADEAARKIRLLGGEVLAEPFNVLDSGRMAVGSDPTGAFFAVWQPGKHFGAGVMNEPGTLCWNELMTTDTKRAGDFYTALFGMKREKFPGPMDYTIFKIGDQQAGGMMKITPGMDSMPTQWMVYFAVANCDASANKAKNLKATVLKEPADIPNIGRFAVLEDPQGAIFYVMQLA